jgi:hypothetical protein
MEPFPRTLISLPAPHHIGLLLAHLLIQPVQILNGHFIITPLYTLGRLHQVFNRVHKVVGNQTLDRTLVQVFTDLHPLVKTPGLNNLTPSLGQLVPHQTLLDDLPHTRRSSRNLF